MAANIEKLESKNEWFVRPSIFGEGPAINGWWMDAFLKLWDKQQAKSLGLSTTRQQLIWSV